MRRSLKCIHIIYIYTVYILFYFFPPPFSLKDTFFSKPSCSALQTTEPRKIPVAFRRWINWSRTDGMDVWKPIGQRKSHPCGSPFFFHEKKNMWKEVAMQLEDFRIFFGQFWRFESWPCRKSNGNPCRAILWLVDCTPQNSTRRSFGSQQMGFLPLPKKKVIVTVSGHW